MPRARFRVPKRMMCLATAIVLAGSVGCLPRQALAQHGEGHQCRHHGSKGGGGDRNRASFQLEAAREIANDWATARLSVQIEGRQSAKVAAQVNAAMAAALDRAKRTDGVEVRSGGYSTHPVYDDGLVVRWRAHQDLVLESGDIDELSKLIGALQSKSVTLNGIVFGVRRETREAIEDELVSEVLARFRARAALVAEGLGAKEWSLGDVSVGTAGSGPPVMVRHERARLSSFADAPPAFEGGTSEVRVTASGTVRLE